MSVGTPETAAVPPAAVAGIAGTAASVAGVAGVAGTAAGAAGIAGTAAGAAAGVAGVAGLAGLAGPALKVCGATTAHDVRMLAEAGADLVGLWHGVPGGRYELAVPEVAALARVARRTGRVRPVLVTLDGDPGALVDVVSRTGVRWVQLHAYQSPSTVRALKAGGPPDLTVVKVLHVRAGACLERRFVGAYARAGVDCFLLDATTEDGRVGSTGHRLAGAAVADLAGELPRPFLLAGGISARRLPDDRAIAGHPRFLGVDVDSGARDGDGRLAAGRVAALRRAWVGAGAAEEASA